MLGLLFVVVRLSEYVMVPADPSKIAMYLRTGVWEIHLGEFSGVPEERATVYKLLY